jgi:hypothetical protein
VPTASILRWRPRLTSASSRYVPTCREIASIWIALIGPLLRFWCPRSPDLPGCRRETTDETLFCRAADRGSRRALRFASPTTSHRLDPLKPFPRLLFQDLPCQHCMSRIRRGKISHCRRLRMPWGFQTKATWRVTSVRCSASRPDSSGGRRARIDGLMVNGPVSSSRPARQRAAHQRI